MKAARHVFNADLDCVNVYPDEYIGIYLNKETRGSGTRNAFYVECKIDAKGKITITKEKGSAFEIEVKEFDE